MRRGRQRDNIGVLLLLQEIFYNIGIQAIPNVTLVATLLQIGIYTRVLPVPWHGLEDCCISAINVFYHREWPRIIFGTLEHADSIHLYYNMISFIWKGMILEPAIGSVSFAYLLVLLTTICGALTAALGYAFGMIMSSQELMFQCAVGFSGVIFALKVINNHYFPNAEPPRFFGSQIRLPSGAYVWLELILIQLTNPNASFIGHLAGIIVGLLYIYGLFDPLMRIVDSTTRTYSSRQSYSYRRSGTNTQLAIPVGTLSLVALVLVVAYKPYLIPQQIYKFLRNPCISAYVLFEQYDLKQLVVASLHHLNSIHLLYSVVTFLRVGYDIEKQRGLRFFLTYLVVSVVLTNVLFCALIQYAIKVHSAAITAGMMYKCFCGLTGALIALKVFGSILDPASGYDTVSYSFLVFELSGLPKGVGVIAEIFFLHLLIPEVSYVGNISGLLVGLGLLLAQEHL